MEMQARPFCWTCRQPQTACYCARLRRFDSGIEFVILIHPIESRRRIATGRMSHLILENSHLIEGEEFSQDRRVQALLDRTDVYPTVLYPGKAAQDLGTLSAAERRALVPEGRRLMIFVIDGTWATARRTMRLSTNLQRLPRLCFSPPHASRFQVRRQPAEHCLSTIEAIHHTIDLFNDADVRPHDHLLEIFSDMVERQKRFLPDGHRRSISQ